jgi:PAS domain S-box-containing protein
LLNLDEAKYLAEGDERYAVEFETNYRDMQAALSSLETSLPDPAQRRHLVEARSALEIYHQGFQNIHANYVRSRELLNIMLGTLGPEISQTASNITASIDREFQTQNEFSQTLIWQTRLVLVIITAIALVAGLGLSIVLSRYISERLRTEQELKAYRDHLEELVEARTVELRQEIGERQRIEDELRQSQMLYRSIVRASPDGMTIFSLQGIIQFVSPASVNMFGYDTAEEMVDRPVLDFIAPDDHELAAIRLQEAALGDPLPPLEYRAVKKDGQIFAIEANTEVIPDANGHPTAVISILRDITARKQTEEVLRLRLRLFEFAAVHSLDELMQKALDEIGLITNSPIGFYHFVEEDQKTLSLQAWSTRTLQEFCQAEGKGLHYSIDEAGVWTDCVHQRKPVIHNNYAALPHRKGMPDGHAKVIRELVVPTMREGRVVSILGVGNKPSEYDGRDIEFVAYVADVIWEIVERKRAEEALRASEEKYRLLVETSTDVIWTVNEAQQFTYISPAILQLRGLTPEEAMQETVAEAICPEFLPRMTESFQKSAAFRVAGKTGFSDRMEIQQPHKDGSRVWVERITRELYDERGEQTSVLGLSRNITERKQMEAELIQARDAAEAANRAKSVFLANMSHELRTPLNAILGFAQLLAREPNLTPKQQQNLETINRSGEHLLVLINGVLDMSKIEAGRVEMRSEEFDLHHLLLGLEEMFHLRVAQKELGLVFEYDPQLPRYIRADQHKLRQILINLLGNALKFTSRGSITLRVDMLPIAGNEPAIDTLRFEVEDTGPGIPADELETIFEAFTQSDDNGQTQQGTGLGLTISRQYARLMGGELTARNKPEQGSIFVLTVPVEIVGQRGQVRPGKIEQRRVAGLMAGQPVYRLLVVEDVEASRQLLIELLQPLGFELREAVNGPEAIDLWQTWQPHLILMDIRLPVMDGLEATRRIRAQQQAGEPPPVIIAVTASVFDEDRVTILAAGCDDVLRKPFRETELFDTLTHHLGVQFVYQDETVVQTVAAEVLTPAYLATMPASWLADLQQAALEGDLAWILSLTEQIQDQEPELADKLHRLADNFQINDIVHFVQSATAIWAGPHPP